MSEAMASHYRQDGLQLREACAQYVNEKEMANKEEMELLRQRLTESSQMMVVNNEMVNEPSHYEMKERRRCRRSSMS